MKNLSIPFFFLTFLIVGNLVGQDLGFQAPTANDPNAEGLTKAVDVSVSQYTGVGTINLPIAGVTGADGAAANVSISYNTSGIKVNQRGGPLGLGWALNAGGTITREVRGLPDETYQFNDLLNSKQYKNIGFLYNNKDYQNKAWDQSFFQGEEVYEKRLMDTEPDIFHFNIAGYAGSFFFSNNNEVVLLNAQDIKVEYTLDSISLQTSDLHGSNIYYTNNTIGTISEFVIILPNGFRYHFDLGSITYTFSGNKFGPGDANLLFDDSQHHHNSSLEPTVFFNCDWTVREIKDPYGIRRVFYDYNKVLEGSHDNYGALRAEFYNNVVYNSINPLIESCQSADRFYEGLSRSHSYIIKKQINSIQLKPLVNTNNNPQNLQELKFYYEKERFDITPQIKDNDYNIKHQGVLIGESKLLTKIEAYQGNELASTHQFHISEYESFSRAGTNLPPDLVTRYKLDKISKTGELNFQGVISANTIDLYTFQYDSTALPPYHSFQKDIWGYYNGDVYNQQFRSATPFVSQYVYPEDHSFISINGGSPYTPYPLDTYVGTEYQIKPNSERINSNLNATKAGSLISVTNATGAQTSIEYELNEFITPNNLRGTSENTSIICQHAQGDADPICANTANSYTLNLSSSKIVDINYNERKYRFFKKENITVADQHLIDTEHLGTITPNASAKLVLNFVISDHSAGDNLVKLNLINTATQVKTPISIPNYNAGGVQVERNIDILIAPGDYELEVEKGSLLDDVYFYLLESYSNIERTNLSIYKNNSLIERYTESASNSLFLEAGQYDFIFEFDPSASFVHESVNLIVDELSQPSNPSKIIGAGLRVSQYSQSKPINENGKTQMVKQSRVEYNYGSELGDFGYSLQNLSFAYSGRLFINECIPNNNFIQNSVRLSSTPQGIGSFPSGSAVGYTRVNEVTYDETNTQSKQGHTSYSFASPNLFPFTSNMCVLGTCFNVTPKKAYPQRWRNTDIGLYPFATFPSNPLQSGVLINSVSYDGLGNRLKEVNIEYDLFNYQSFPSLKYSPRVTDDYEEAEQFETKFFNATYSNISFDLRIKSKTEVTYGDNENGSLTTTTSYFYENSNLSIPTRTVVASGGNTIENTVYYPNGTSYPDQNLETLNILHSPTRSEKKINSVLVSASQPTYKWFTSVLGNRYNIDFVESSGADGKTIIDYKVIEYDNVNINSPKIFERFGEIGQHTVTYDDLGRVEKHEYLDLVDEYTYYGQTGLLKETLDHGYVVAKYNYDNLGRLREKKTRNDNITESIDIDIVEGVRITKNISASDGSFFPKKVTQLDPFGRKILETLEGFMPDGGNYTKTYTYDGLGRLLTNCDPLKGSCSFINYFPSTDERIVRTGREGWEGVNQISRKFTEDKYSIQTTIDAEGIVSETWQNSLGQKIKSVSCVGCEEEAITLYTYDEYGRLLTVTQPEGTQFVYTYSLNNSNNELTTNKTIPGGGTTVTIVDEEGKKKKVTDPNGNVFEYVYDNYDRLEQVLLNSQVVQDFDLYGFDSSTPYGNRGQIQKETHYMIGNATAQALGQNEISYTYDQYGRLIEENHSTINGTDKFEFLDMNMRDESKHIKRIYQWNNSTQKEINEFLDFYPSGDIKWIEHQGVTQSRYRLAEYEYSNQSLWLMKKRLGVEDTEELTEVSFGYNPLGWLTKINSLNECVPNDVLDPDEGVNEEGGDSYNTTVTITFHPFRLITCHNTDFEIFINGDLHQTLNLDFFNNEHTSSHNNFNYLFSKTFIFSGHNTYETLLFSLSQMISQTILEGIFDFLENLPDGNFKDNLLTAFNDKKSEIRDHLNKSNYSEQDFFQVANDEVCFNSRVIYSILNAIDDWTKWLLPPEEPTCSTTPVLFAEKIHYEKGIEGLSPKGYLDGTISGMQWQVLDDPIRMYGFEYDGQKQLIKGEYAERSGVVGSDWYVEPDYSTQYGYDLNGNVKSIIRKGLVYPNQPNSIYNYIDRINLIYSGNTLSHVSEPTNFYSTKGYKGVSGGGSFTYDNAGNTLYDGNRQITYSEYTALNMPQTIQKGSQTLTSYYDASGTKWRSTHVKSGTNLVVWYMNGLEKVNGNTVIHHSEGRILENSGTESPFEFVISDHLGNGRVWFRDLNWDGDLNIDSQDPGLEVTQVKHYYPFGFEMDIQTPQAAMPANDQDRKTYNGIESFGSLGVQVAHYRILDPGIGRWMQVDPKAEKFYGLTPYNSMGNNPISSVDPDGDEFITSAIFGALVGVISNGIQNSINGEAFFKGAGKAAAFGALAGTASSMIGGISSGIGNELAKSAFQAGAHGLNGGFNSLLQGGEFYQGALTGSISSGFGSAATSLKLGTVGMYAAGAMGGGLGSYISGGDVANGVGMGIITTALNHSLHSAASSGFFGKNVKAAVHSGRSRHLFGPDATYQGVGGSIYGLGGVFFEFGSINMLRGSEAGTSVGYRNFGTGIGVSMSAGGTSGSIYYSGSKSSFNSRLISGRFIGYTFGVSAGLGWSYTKTFGLNDRSESPNLPRFSGVTTSDWGLDLNYSAKLGAGFGILMGRTYIEGYDY